MCLQGLFKKGMSEAAEKQLAAGLEEGWSLNAAVYEQLILGLCQIGNTTEATRMLNRMDVRLFDPRAADKSTWAASCQRLCSDRTDNTAFMLWTTAGS